jgi:hypothetical protein
MRTQTSITRYRSKHTPFPRPGKFSLFGLLSCENPRPTVAFPRRRTPSRLPAARACWPCCPYSSTTSSSRPSPTPVSSPRYPPAPLLSSASFSGPLPNRRARRAQIYHVDGEGKDAGVVYCEMQATAPSTLLSSSARGGVASATGPGAPGAAARGAGHG